MVFTNDQHRKLLISCADHFATDALMATDEYRYFATDALMATDEHRYFATNDTNEHE